MFDMGRRGGKNETEGNEAERELSAITEAAVPSAPRARVRDAAVLGPSIHVNGELRGAEDLIIEGEVIGSIQLAEHCLTIGGNGKVKAEIYAHTVFVDGSVEGDVYGSDRVVIRKSGSIQGNVVSPRVSLDDGGRIKGTMEMDPERVKAAFADKKLPQPPATRAEAKPAGDGPQQKLG